MPIFNPNADRARVSCNCPKHANPIAAATHLEGLFRRIAQNHDVWLPTGDTDTVYRLASICLAKLEFGFGLIQSNGSTTPSNPPSEVESSLFTREFCPS